MKPYETSATVADRGSLQLGELPFPAGTPVEVSVRPKPAGTFSKQSAHDELEQAYNECRVANWDGDGADPIAPDTLQHAHRFVEALPPGYPSPSVSAEPDGHIALEWYRATNWLLSVSVSPEGTLCYAALLGDEDPRGTCRFDGEAPETILYWIRRVCAI